MLGTTRHASAAHPRRSVQQKHRPGECRLQRSVQGNFAFDPVVAHFTNLVAHVRSVARRDETMMWAHKDRRALFIHFTRCKSDIRKSPVMCTTRLHV